MYILSCNYLDTRSISSWNRETLRRLLNLEVMKGDVDSAYKALPSGKVTA